MQAFFNTIFLFFKNIFDLSSVGSGIISGLVSSLIIYILIFAVKPKIKISNHIAESSENGKTIYKIKIVNRSIFTAFNLNYSLHYCKIKSDGIIQITEIKPSKSLIHYIAPPKRGDETDKHAIRLSYNIDKNKYALNDNSYFRFALVANHGFSNTTCFIEKEYRSKDIRNGKFETGNSLKVIEF